MTVQSDDGRLTVQRYTDSTVMMVGVNGLLSEQQVFDALLPLLPPAVPTAREVALAAFEWFSAAATPVMPGSFADLIRRWDESGRP